MKVNKYWEMSIKIEEKVIFQSFCKLKWQDNLSDTKPEDSLPKKMENARIDTCNAWVCCWFVAEVVEDVESY